MSSHRPGLLTVFPEAVFPSTDIRNTDAEQQLLAMFRNRTFIVGYPTIENNKGFNSLTYIKMGITRIGTIKLNYSLLLRCYLTKVSSKFDFLRGAAYFDKGELKTFQIDGYGSRFADLF